LGSAVLVIKKADLSVSATFELPGFPAAVLIDEQWKILEFHYPSGVKDVFDYLSRVTALPSERALKTTSAQWDTGPEQRGLDRT
jgi:hypothetical protein